jgi:O-antigen/teichoic acid export membrane protein
VSIYKKLVGQTAIYGLSSIVGRVINFLLTPLLTVIFIRSDYGIYSEFYAYSTFLLILFTYGFETAFFKFWKSEDDKQKVYSTAFFSILTTTFFLSGLAVLFRHQIADFLGYPDRSIYVIYFALIIGFDSLISIPLARLRQNGKAALYAVTKLSSIFVSVGFVLFFLLYCPWIVERSPQGWISTWFNPNFGVGYVFLANLIASTVSLIILIPQLKQLSFSVDSKLWKRMMIFAVPLLFAGLAGTINETLDRILLKYMLPYDTTTNLALLGVYSGCYKLSMFMTLAVQAFRMGAEPFFFAQSTEKNAPQTYAKVMRYFVITGLLIFVGVNGFIDILKHFVAEPYHEGLVVVPILLLANLLLGVFFNLSIWYKLTSRTSAALVLALIGATVTVVLNVIWIPTLGYVGSAWATLCCYFLMAAVSYLWGKKHFPIPYPLKAIGLYSLLAFVIFFLHQYLRNSAFSENLLGSLISGGVGVLIFIATAYFFETKKKVLI